MYPQVFYDSFYPCPDHETIHYDQENVERRRKKALWNTKGCRIPWYQSSGSSIDLDLMIPPTRKGSGLPPIWKNFKLWSQVVRLRFEIWDLNRQQWCSIMLLANADWNGLEKNILSTIWIPKISSPWRLWCTNRWIPLSLRMFNFPLL